MELATRCDFEQHDKVVTWMLVFSSSDPAFTESLRKYLEKKAQIGEPGKSVCSVIHVVVYFAFDYSSVLQFSCPLYLYLYTMYIYQNGLLE